MQIRFLRLNWPFFNKAPFVSRKIIFRKTFFGFFSVRLTENEFSGKMFLMKEKKSFKLRKMFPNGRGHRGTGALSLGWWLTARPQ